MTIRQITTEADMKAWLPSDYSSAGGAPADIDQALTDGHDPRMIAAEVWEEYAGTIDETGDARPVQSWTNLDTSVEDAAATSPRDFALRQARHHRARAKVKVVALVNRRLEREEPEGLLNEPPAEPPTTTSGPR